MERRKYLIFVVLTLALINSDGIIAERLTIVAEQRRYVRMTHFRHARMKFRDERDRRVRKDIGRIYHERRFPMRIFERSHSQRDDERGWSIALFVTADIRDVMSQFDRVEILCGEIREITCVPLKGRRKESPPISSL